ncbi:hypothetical protein FGO68_gene17591 [Halteria grandinella]|uniref:TLDc domain-containing protein n=1 Tax=Halteria grandinella TaxID=5974 RepID=A0A8J8SZ42_HALGN|nr:hypothetical protein FGO68_gene17591 [Halteria grandinella]
MSIGQKIQYQMQLIYLASILIVGATSLTSPLNFFHQALNQVHPHIGDCSGSFSHSRTLKYGESFTCTDKSDDWLCTIKSDKAFTCELKEKRYFQESTLGLTQEDAAWLADLLPYDSIKTNLLFRGSRDGWAPKDFHDKCDNQGPTIVFYKYKDTGRVAAGFSSLSWESESPIHTIDNKGMLFAINQRQYANAIGNTQAMLTLAGYGPNQGQVNLGHLGAPSNPMYNSGECRCGYSSGFSMPFEKDGRTCVMSGLPNGYHKLEELEVWQIVV